GASPARIRMRAVLPEPFFPRSRWLDPGGAARSTGPTRNAAPPPGGGGAAYATPSSRITDRPRRLRRPDSGSCAGSHRGPRALVEEGADLVHDFDQGTPRRLRETLQVLVFRNSPFLARREDGRLHADSPQRRLDLRDRARELHPPFVTHAHADRRLFREVPIDLGKVGRVHEVSCVTVLQARH